MNCQQHRSRGFTIVEMMVAVAVTSIMMVGVIQLFSSNKQAYRIQEGASVMNENARYALNLMQYDLRLADHWGGIEPADVAVDTTSGAIAFTNDCAEAPILPADPNAGVVGFEGFEGVNANSPLSCIANADYEAQTDILVIRYAGPRRAKDDENTEPARVNNIRSDSGLFLRAAVGRRAIVYEGVDVDDVPADLATPTAAAPQFADYPFNTIIYFVRPCASPSITAPADQCNAGDDDTPTLARLVLQDRTLVQEEVVSGVEQFQVTYGVDRNGDLVADQYEGAADIRAAAGYGWADVVDIRISLVMRNMELDTTANTGGSDADHTHNLVGGFNYVVPTDERLFRRKVYNFVVQVRNQTRA